MLSCVDAMPLYLTKFASHQFSLTACLPMAVDVAHTTQVLCTPKKSVEDCKCVGAATVLTAEDEEQR